jgi:hypothetical protein
MYGYPTYGYGYGNSWLWIIIVVLIIFFILFWCNGNNPGSIPGPGPCR